MNGESYVNGIKKVLISVYSFCVFFFMFYYVQLVFNKMSHEDYFQTGNISEGLCYATSAVLMDCISTCTVVLVGIGLHFIFYILLKIASRNKVFSVALFVCDIAVSIICIVCVSKLINYSNTIRGFLQPSGAKYNYYEYSYVNEARALVIMPFVTGLIISCANLATSIISIIINIKSKPANEQI